jgi:hypothetical protein
LVSIYHESTAYTGTVLDIDIGNNVGGTFSSGNFISLKNDGSQKFHIDSDGNVFATLNNANSEAVCHSGDDAEDDAELTSCSGGPSADYAEMYPSASNVDYGEVVVIGDQDVITQDGFIIKQVVHSTKGYDENVLGITSNNYGDFSSTGYVINEHDHPIPVALSGRVPVKFSAENGEVLLGDYITSAATMPGYAMKATQPGFVIGQVIETQIDGRVMVFVRSMYYDPTTTIDENGVLVMQNSEGIKLSAETSDSAAVIIDQQGSGDLLQIQTSGTDRFLVKNNGEININVTSADEIDQLIVVKSNDSEIFTINARGQVEFSGNIFIKDDTFAGSIATNAEGLAEIIFTYHLGSGKPSIQLTPESDNPVFAQVLEWMKDAEENYTGFKMKTFALDGTATSAVVHYLVVGKQADY